MRSWVQPSKGIHVPLPSWGGHWQMPHFWYKKLGCFTDTLNYVCLLCSFHVHFLLTRVFLSCSSINPTNDIEINDPSSFSYSCVANCHCLETQAAMNKWRCATPPIRFEAGQKTTKEDLLSSRAFGGRFLHRYYGVARWPHLLMVGVGWLGGKSLPHSIHVWYLWEM